jgi:hypothetical protein
VTLSNVKQDALAEIMYQTDYDDTFVLAAAWNTGNDPVSWSSTMSVSTWVWLVQPYQKNADIDNDPMAPTVAPPSGWPKAVWVSLFSSIGYNYGGLSPFMLPASSGGLPYTQTVSSTALSNPAGMPMFAGKDAASEMTSGTEYVYAYQFNSGVDNGPMLNNTIERPFCNEANYCLASWGYDMTSDEQGQVDTLLSDNILAGARTGRCALRNSSNAVFSFADGHAKKLTPGAASVGTNFNINQSSSLTVITNADTYLWTVSPGSY